MQEVVVHEDLELEVVTMDERVEHEDLGLLLNEALWKKDELEVNRVVTGQRPLKEPISLVEYSCNLLQILLSKYLLNLLHKTLNFLDPNGA